MNARLLAIALQRAGLPILNVTEPDEDVDGMIEITDKVHVQVPLFGNQACVVRKTDKGTFEFSEGRLHTAVDSVVFDISMACAAQVACEANAAEVSS